MNLEGVFRTKPTFCIPVQDNRRPAESENGGHSMKSMTLPEIRAAIEADPRKLCFLKSIASLTTEQANRIIDFLKFGWARIQAGEDVGAVMAEWKELQRT